MNYVQQQNNKAHQECKRGQKSKDDIPIKHPHAQKLLVFLLGHRDGRGQDGEEVGFD
jgi:hypothetical protein